MPSTQYSTVTPLPASPQVCEALISAFEHLLRVRTTAGLSSEIVGEVYARVSDYRLLREPSPHGPVSDHGAQWPSEGAFGSAWVLECLPNQAFHTHSFSTGNPLLSARRILFVADAGMTIEIFPVPSHGQPSEYLEHIRLEGPTFAELEFDGRLVHRFRPAPGGRLFAYSMHLCDADTSAVTLEIQTIPYQGEIPTRIEPYVLASAHVS